jgi:hypothetical protein
MSPAVLALALATGLASATWLYAVVELHVLARQTHHFYYGLVLLASAVPFYDGHALARALAWVGFAVLLDDAVQHAVQLAGKRRQSMTLYLWRSPVHLFGHWLGLY